VADQPAQATAVRGAIARTAKQTTASPGGVGGAIARWFGGPGSWRNTITGLVFLVIAAWVVLSAGLPQQDVNLADVAFMYAIVGTGIALLYHYGGLLAIAHGSLWGIGAYFAAILAMRHGWPMLPILIVAAIGCALAAMLLASISLRVQGSYFIIVLFAVSEVVYGVMNNWTAVTAGAEGIVVTAPASIFGYHLNSNDHWYWATLVTLVIVLVITQAIKGSRIGQRLKAIRDNRNLAISVGVNVTRTHMIAFAITGAIAGISGVYWGYFEGYVVPSQYSTTASIDFVLVVLLGGSAYLLGPTIGSIVLIFLPSVLHLSPLLGDAVIGVIFIAVILLSPSGIAGIFERSFRWFINRLSGGGGPSPAPLEALETDLAADAATEELSPT
jgi:branched-chain amino acid transport system permease protein